MGACPVPITLCLPEWVTYTRMGNPRERRGVPVFPLRRGRYYGCTLPHCQAIQTFDGSSSLKNMSCVCAFFVAECPAIAC